MKRIIALLLALILTVGLLPTVALAAGETANTDVKSGSIGEDGKWTTAAPDQSNKPEGVETVSKTAKPTSNPNEYEVKLKVVLKQTSETKTGAAATALVLDCSGSMDWCTECGRDWCRHKTDDTYNVTFDVHNSNSYYVFENGKYVRVSYCDGYHFLNSCDGGAGWYTSDRKRDHKSQNKLTPKISQTDSAATHVQFYTRTEGSFDTSRMTAAKNAAKNFLKTYSGFDASAINDDGTLKQSAENLSIKRYVAVIRFSKNIDNDTDSSYWGDYKPAWYDVSTKDGYGKVLATINNASAGGGTNLDAGLTTASSLMDANLVKNLTSKNVIALTDGAPTYSKSYGDGGSTNQDICNETAKTAETLREKSKVYTVCFAAESDPLYNGGGTVGDFLKNRIATQPAEGSNEKYAYNAKSAEDLIKVFKDITDTIVSGLNNGTVKDSLPAGITSTDFGNATQFELNDQKQFHKDVKTETVDGKEVTTYTYTKTYTVKIDPKTVKTEKVDGVDYAPLNGETTLTVKNGDEDVEIPFPIPAGKVTMPSYTVTWKSQDGNNTLETDSNVEYNTKPTFNSDAPTKADDAQYTYTFVGWATEANQETGTPEANLPNVTADVTYYAAFSKTPRTYTVTWMPQDGQGNAYETDTGVAYNASPSYDSEVPTKAADDKYTYTFAGWATTTNQMSGSTVDALPNVTENVTYYAAFSATPRTYTVTFKDGANGEVFEDETQQVEYGKAIPSHADPVRPGYNFTGWTSEPANYQPGTGTMPANNITFTAQWTEKTSVTISYVAKEGGSVNKASESLNPDTGEATGSTATASTGYTFDGWYDNEECTGDALSTSAEYKPTKPTTGWVNGTTFYAKFTKNTYTVTYTDGVNGTAFENQSTSDVAYGAPIPAFNGTPTRAGYNFTDWTSNVEGVTPSSTMPDSDVTFTAQWTEKGSVTINYVAKTGGSVTLASETLNPDTGVAAGSTATPNAGYAFAGWYSDFECTEANKVSSNVDFTPTKPEGGWVTTTYYAKFEQIQVDVDLSPYVKKTLEVDGTLPTVFSETFKVNVTVDGQLLQQQGTVTMTAADTNNFSMPTVTLTCGVHTIVVQEVVDPETKNSNIAYGTNPESFVLNVTASGVQYGSTDSERNFVAATGSPFVTITNKYTRPTETFDLNSLITKKFEAAADSKPIPNGTYTFTAQIFKADDTWQQVGESPVYTGTATLNGAASGAAFDFDSSRNPTLASGTHRYLVKEVNGGVAGITYDPTVYHLMITVNEDGTQPNVQIEAETQASVLSVQPVEFASKITFTNTYFEEKDPTKCTIDFSKFVKKELTATGSKTVDEATFIVDVVGSYDGGAIANALIPNETHATMDEDVLNTTLTATIKNIVGGNVYEVPFNGYVTVSKPGHYTFTLTEHKGTQSGVTYDETRYQVSVNVEQIGDNLVIHDATTYLNNEQVELIKLVNDVPVTAGYIVFKNTIDTGKDDYYPIIIPTIINKDTGMLNKTDHFAYVIGYPDGTVHPNGQITRAEVATIFFRLLRDEVRDGAFTTSNSYSDVAYGKWYNNPISTMSALGIITGYPDGTFKPNKPITRAEFAAIAARFDETQSGKSATFSDVIGHWAAKEIGIAYYNDWIKGYPDGTFKPDQNITRAEAMTLINRVLERKPESPADLLTNMNKWTDNMDTSKWYYLDVQEATNSHGYTRKTFNYELWRQMLPDPDWSRYER